MTIERLFRRIACALAPLTLIALLQPFALHAAPSGEPKPVKLTVSTAKQTVLTVHGANGIKRLSLADLEQLGVYQVTTSTFWPDDTGSFEGPLLRDVLKLAGIENTEHVRIHALDGFSQVLPHADWQKWPVILATRHNGKTMNTREKGPLRIIYPRDMSPDLADATYRLRWVWLVDAIEPVAR
jgi:hypothetical protein